MVDQLNLDVVPLARVEPHPVVSDTGRTMASKKKASKSKKKAAKNSSDRTSAASKSTTGRRHSGESVVFECVSAHLVDGAPALVFFASAKDLWDLLKINMRAEDKDEGYQRALSETRVEKIAQYIDAGSYFPTAIVVTFNNATLDKQGKRLSVPNVEDAGWIIDGQHRMAGAHAAKRDVIVAVVAFLDLDLRTQINQFVTINRTAKGVPTSLYYDLMPQLDLPNVDEKRATELRAKDIGKELTVDPESPFFERILVNRPPKRGKELSLTNFIRKVAPHLKYPSGCLTTIPVAKRATLLSSCYRAAESVFVEEFAKPTPFFYKTVGFGAMMDALPGLISRLLQMSGNLRARDFEKLFAAVDIDFAKWEGMGTGRTRESEAATEFLAAVDAGLTASKVPESKVKFD
ncbi:MAG: DGQHR domain-containing protein [Anaerolineales bacterium]